MTEQKITDTVDIGVSDDYEAKYGFRDDRENIFKSRKGLDTEIINQMCDIKDEPDWMREYRLKAYEIYKQKAMIKWGGDLSQLDFDDIYYYVKASDRPERSWDDVPDDIKKTFDRLGIPEAERKFLAGVGAQYDSEVVYHSVEKELEKIGVIFVSMDTAVSEYPDLVKEYFGTLIPSADNKFAALNSAIWSGGSLSTSRPALKLIIHCKRIFISTAKTWGSLNGR